MSDVNPNPRGWVSPHGVFIDLAHVVMAWRRSGMLYIVFDLAHLHARNDTIHAGALCLGTVDDEPFKSLMSALEIYRSNR